MAFIHDDFLLGTKTGRRLYHEIAKGQPIIDYHNHLPPRSIAENEQFGNLFDIWLAGDHYKWRAMRANGIEERFITGDAKPKEKFLAWARTVPATVRNPLYHWTHLELARYFGITDLLNEQSAERIWNEANDQLATQSLRVHGILKKFAVAALCTTDDPADDLSWHGKAEQSGLATKVYPAFRPDRALTVDRPDAFNSWLDQLESVGGVSIRSLPDFIAALDSRHGFFHDQGCRLSDHGLARCFADFPTEVEAARIFDKARAGSAASPDEHAQFAAHMMLQFGYMDARRGWTKQLHLGALRSANTAAVERLGPDTGFDSIGDHQQGQALASYLDRLNREDALPRMILYNNNPSDNYLFAAIIGSFQGGSVGKMQFGSGWWFLDTKEGIEWQLNALSNNGLLSRFVGMLTDSRSFMSFPRHEYFRRILCETIGREMENGEIPDDDELVGGMIKDICYGNVRRYLNLPGMREEGK